MRRFSIVLLMLCMTVVPWEAGAQTQSQEFERIRGATIRLGVLANRGREMCLTEWIPTADYLSQQLAPSQFEIVPLGFAEVGEAVQERRVEFLLVNPSMYVTLEYRGLVNRIATFLEPSIMGRGPLPLFGGVIFAKTDRTDLKSLQDFKGKRFSAVQSSSLGGWHAAWREFERAGIHPLKDFAQLEFAGTHDDVVEAVRSGQADGGTVRSTQLERMALEGRVELHEFKIFKGPLLSSQDYPFLLSTHLYPEWPFAAVKGTDLELGKSVASALLRMGADDPAAIASRGAGWAIPQDYASVHECLRELHIPPYEDYGKVTLRQAIAQHWGPIMGILSITLVILALALHAYRTSARLRESFAALRESEMKYRGVIENIQDVFYRVDASGRIALISPSAARLLGYDSVDDLIGKSPDAFWGDPSQRLALLDELNRSGHVRDWEFSARRRDGSLLMAAISLNLLQDHEGKPMGYEGIWRDITERKRTEDAVKMSEERLALALKATNDALWDWDLEKDELYHSPRWYEMLGYTEKELESAPGPWRGLIHPEDSDRADGILRSTLEKGVGFEVENRLLHRDGHYVPVVTHGFILRNEQGEAVRASGTHTDLTERKQAEEERKTWEHRLQQAQKAESLGRMAGAVAHHFNNMLTGVLGNLELALHALPEEEMPRTLITQAMKASVRAVEISQLMLAYVGQTVRKKKPVDLAEVTRELLSPLRPTLSLRVHLNDDLPSPGPIILGDMEGIGQILSNLLSNAAEAIGDQEGTITVSVRTISHVEIRGLTIHPSDWEPKAAGYACLMVADSGCGMDAMSIENIFDPFFSTKFTGRGLGLAVVFGLVRAHQGAIAVQSEPGKGSQLLALFALAEEKPSAPQREDAPASVPT